MSTYTLRVFLEFPSGGTTHPKKRKVFFFLKSLGESIEKSGSESLDNKTA